LKLLLSALSIVLSLAAPAQAQPAAEFYKGKTIRVIVGTSPGDYDTWVRLVVRYLPQYIPGQPNFVVENMPGAGSLIAANHLYNRAARDGTVLGSVSRNIPHYAFAKKANANFDPLKFHWIGSPEVNNRGCFARADSGVRTARDLLERELVVGTDGAGTSLSEMPVLLKNLLGMRFRTVDGYKGSNDVVLAIQRNEVQGICQTLTAFSQSAQHMLDNGTVRLLFTTERDPVPGSKAPTIFEFTSDEEQRMILDFQASALETGRPWLAPPEVPADRVALLRRAFNAAMKDPALLDDAKKRGLDVNPRTGEQVEAVLRKAAAFPPELLAKLAQLTKR
jgi:tripartite-type tricarboxylate transporter receptor subunit TctC